MRLLDIFSRHPHADISAHADGELAPDRRGALETHLAGCQPCQTELDELLAVRSALRDLPPVAAPRSFTLTPAMAERERAPVTPRTTPSFVAMRVAGAGFAAVLAVVVMLDAGGIVNDSGGRSSDEPSSLGFLNVDPTDGTVEANNLMPGDDAAAPSAGGDGDPQAAGGSVGAYGSDALPEVSDGDILDGLAGTPPADDDSSLPSTGGVGGGIGGPDGSEDAPDGGGGNRLIEPDDAEQAPGEAPLTSDDIDKIAASDGQADVADSGDGAPEPGEGAPAAFAPEDDGVSTLLVIEIGLAAIAVLAIGGSFVIRRRAGSE